MTATESVREYLDSKGWSYRIDEKCEAILNCPLCDDREQKFAINVESGAWNCKHVNRCGKSGNLYQLKKELGDLREDLGKYVKKPAKAYTRPQVKPHALTAESSAWFAGRKITQPTLERFKIRQDESRGVMFPYFKGGQLVNVKYRKLPKEFSQEKGAESSLFGRDLVPADSKSILILEGEMDVLAAWEYGIEAVSVPEGAGSDKWIAGEWEFLQHFKTIYIGLDNDTAGDAGVEKLQKRLATWDLRRVELPAKDMNDCLMQGVSVETVKKCIDEARDLTPPEVKRLSDIDFDSVKEPDHGMPCEIPGLTEKLGGWRLGELTIHAGEAYSGKTTATLQEAFGALRRFKTVCLCNLEQKITSVVWTMIQQSGLSRADFLKCFADSLIFLDLHHGVQVEKLLELMQYVARRYGAQYFTVDSLGCIEIPISDHWLRQKDTIAQLARFAKDSDIHLALVHHLRKQGKDHGVRVDHADLEGSAWIRNLADNVVFYKRLEKGDREKRPQLEGIDEVLHVDKNRALGVGGEIALRFDAATKRFEGPKTEDTSR